MDPVRPPPDGGSTLRRWWRGPESDPQWARPGLVALLVATAVLYLWGLGANGWADTYYSAAVQAGTQSWKAFFFGSLDASNFITVDKTPLAFWPMVLSARLFGFSSWSMLVPQALMGVATVGILYATIRRWFGAGAGLVAGAVCALTPVTTLMFRFNHPDAALTLLMTIGAYCIVRALEQDSTKWIVGAGVAVGLAFLAKELQAFLVLPAFGLVYLLAAPPRLGRRVWHCALLGLSTLAAGLWWVLIVELWPASSRPYIGGSQNNSLWNVLLGYNGLGRLTGKDPVGAGGVIDPFGNGASWGRTGVDRLFNDSFGAQASWLIPAALVLLVAGLLWTARRPRTDRSRAGLVLWGAWLVVTGLTFSLSDGIIHEYYTVALTPAIGAVIGIGGTSMWARRETLAARCVLAITVAVTALWSAALLDRLPEWHPWLHDVVLIGGIVTAVALLLPPIPHRLALRVLAAAVLAMTLVVGLLGPAAFSLATATTVKGSPIPLAGPSRANGLVASGLRDVGSRLAGSGLSTSGIGSNISGFTGSPDGRSIRATPPDAQSPRNAGRPPNPASEPADSKTRDGAHSRSAGPDGSLVGTRLRALLANDIGRYRWAAAAVTGLVAADYALASGAPVMAVGGWNIDPAPSLAEFRRYVGDGDIHYFIATKVPYQGQPRRSTARAVTRWVTTNFEPRVVDGITLYDLTQPAPRARPGRG